MPEYFQEAVPTRNERNIWVEIIDASNPVKRRRMPYISADIPHPMNSEELPVFIQGNLVAVHRGNNVIPTGTITVPYGAFLDPSQPTLDEIIAGTGEGANWTPTNDATANVRVEGHFRVFTVVFHSDVRSFSVGGQTGSYTKRTLSQVYLKRNASSGVAAPTPIQYSLMIFGTIVDSWVTVT